MRQWLSPFFLCLVFASGASHSQSRPPTLSEITHAYLSIKAGVASAMAKVEATPRSGGSPNRISFVSCLGVAPIVGSRGVRPGIPYEVVHLAYEVGFVKHQLENTYAPDLWRSKLIDFESAQLLELADGRDVSRNTSDFKRKLAEDLNAHQRVHPESFPIISMISAECNAGGVQVEITSTPAGARIRYMNAFSFKLCIDPALKGTSQTWCAWNDYGGVLLLAGEFVFRAEWADGISHEERINIDQIAPTGGTRKLNVLK